MSYHMYVLESSSLPRSRFEAHLNFNIGIGVVQDVSLFYLLRLESLLCSFEWSHFRMSSTDSKVRHPSSYR